MHSIYDLNRTEIKNALHEELCVLCAATAPLTKKFSGKKKVIEENETFFFVWPDPLLWFAR